MMFFRKISRWFWGVDAGSDVRFLCAVLPFFMVAGGLVGFAGAYFLKGPSGLTGSVFSVSRSLSDGFEFSDDTQGEFFGLVVREDSRYRRWFVDPSVESFSSSDPDSSMVLSVRHASLAASDLLVDDDSSVLFEYSRLARLEELGFADLFEVESAWMLVDEVFDGMVFTGNVKGGSAGLMFALAFVDALSPGDLSAGLNIAGSGVVYNSGVYSVRDADVKFDASLLVAPDVFFVPFDNFDFVRSEEGVDVVRVSSVREAVDFLCSVGATDAVCDVS